MKETPRREITVMSSFNKISTDQLGKNVGLRGGIPTPFGSRLPESYFMRKLQEF
jgi:hypothetical protein